MALSCNVLLLISCFLAFGALSAQTVQLKSLTQLTTMRQIENAPFTNFASFNRRRRPARARRRVRARCRGPEILRYRTLTGECNNRRFPNRGAAHRPFLILARSRRNRFFAQNLPNARQVSNIVHEEAAPKRNDRGMSELVTFFGQLIDHTVTETEVNLSKPLRIRVPRNDPVFNEKQFIPFFRTVRAGGPQNNRAPLNLLSSYIDADSVYGINEEDARNLRELKGGRLRTPGGLLPRKNGPNSQFIAGDRRVNENPNLAALHLLFALEHNKVAAEVASAYPDFSDEEIYKLARHVVAAELQAVTWYEFLPALTGSPLPPYRGYRRGQKAIISNMFSTVAFRVGHTLLNRTVNSVDANGKWKKFMLRDVFFNPSVLTNEGISNIFRGMMFSHASEVDAGITGEVRNFLIDRAASIEQLDLAALNIQRGRDHDVPSCNDLRVSVGLRPFFSFFQVAKDHALARKLLIAYRGNIGDMDPWTCGVAEKHVRGSSLGALFHRIVRREFRRLRDGDRFYFERSGYFTADQIKKIPTVAKLVGSHHQRGRIMSMIIKRNTDIPPNQVKQNPFFV